MFKDIFIRASASELVSASRVYKRESGDNVDKKSLKRVFRLLDLTILGISMTVGSGIFVIAGTAGKSFAGSSLVLSILIGGFSQFCTSFAHMEFASRIPIIGSVYTYAYNSSGEFLAFVLAFQGILDPLAASVNACGAAGYFKSFLIACGVNRESVNNSIWFGYKPHEDSFMSISLLPPILLFLQMLMAIFDVGLSKNFVNYFTIWNISLLILFIVCGSFLINTDIWIHPCDHTEFGVECPIDAKNSFFPYGINGTLSGALIACWSFMGLENIVTVAEECINPIKDIPRGIFISLVFVSILYVAVILVINGMVPFQALDPEASLSESLASHNELLLHQMISLGASTTMFMLSFASLIGSTRKWFRVGVDGLCFPVFKYIHPKFRTPFYTILLYAIISMLTSLMFDLGSILSFAAVAALLNLTSVSIGLLPIRYAPVDNQGADNEKVYWWNEIKLICLSWIYFLFCLIFCSIEVNREYFKENNMFGLWIVLIVIFVLVLIGIIGLFCYFHYKYPWKKWILSKGYEEANVNVKHKMYLMPGCPYLPLMLILLNSYLIACMDLKMIGELTIIWAVAVPMYFCYSYRHSKLRKQRLTKKVSTMIALTSIEPVKEDIGMNEMVSKLEAENVVT
eukprot:259849_1